MIEIIDRLTDGLLDREADTGSTVSWNGQTVPCSGGAARDGKTLDFGGFKLNAAVVLVVRISILDPTKGLPALKQTVQYLSAPSGPTQSLRLENLTIIYNAILVLECNDPNQAA